MKKTLTATAISRALDAALSEPLSPAEVERRTAELDALDHVREVHSVQRPAIIPGHVGAELDEGVAEAERKLLDARLERESRLAAFSTLRGLLCDLLWRRFEIDILNGWLANARDAMGIDLCAAIAAAERSPDVYTFAGRNNTFTLLAQSREVIALVPPGIAQREAQLPERIALVKQRVRELQADLPALLDDITTREQRLSSLREWALHALTET